MRSPVASYAPNCTSEMIYDITKPSEQLITDLSENYAKKFISRTNNNRAAKVIFFFFA
jgi:hypothetical protein